MKKSTVFFLSALSMLIGVIITGMGGLIIGLITMLGSAVIGAFWAWMNMNAQKKKAVEEEEQRFQAYSEYLQKKEEEIKGFFWTNGVLFENREEEDISINELKELIRKVEEGK